ncbi:hypothetical protein GCM10010195_58180 [Kitasatospora griseola]|nr:hypothetical protein GCM10010195_58180 [Kitasatospora griseola]
MSAAGRRTESDPPSGSARPSRTAQLHAARPHVSAAGPGSLSRKGGPMSDGNNVHHNDGDNSGNQHEHTGDDE